MADKRAQPAPGRDESIRHPHREGDIDERETSALDDLPDADEAFEDEDDLEDAGKEDEGDEDVEEV